MHAATFAPFDTQGSYLHPGRWHSAGTRLVHTAEHASLLLETLIHAGGRKIPPRVLTQIDMPSDLFIESAPWIERSDSQSFGDAWVRESRSAVLRVPSIAVNLLESNFLLSSSHPAFSAITHLAPRPFDFDPRFILFPQAS
jgi:RES domain-containing protein